MARTCLFLRDLLPQPPQCSRSSAPRRGALPGGEVETPLGRVGVRDSVGVGASSGTTSGRPRVHRSSSCSPIVAAAVLSRLARRSPRVRRSGARAARPLDLPLPPGAAAAGCGLESLDRSRRPRARSTWTEPARRPRGIEAARGPAAGACRRWVRARSTDARCAAVGRVLRSRRAGGERLVGGDDVGRRTCPCPSSQVVHAESRPGGEGGGAQRPRDEVARHRARRAARRLTSV